MADLQLFMVGLIMASSVYSDGPVSDPRPEEDFELWVASWDQVKPAFDRQAGELGWRTFGSRWEYKALS